MKLLLIFSFLVLYFSLVQAEAELLNIHGKFNLVYEEYDGYYVKFSELVTLYLQYLYPNKNFSLISDVLPFQYVACFLILLTLMNVFNVLPLLFSMEFIYTSLFILFSCLGVIIFVLTIASRNFRANFSLRPLFDLGIPGLDHPNIHILKRFSFGIFMTIALFLVFAIIDHELSRFHLVYYETKCGQRVKSLVEIFASFKNISVIFIILSAFSVLLFSFYKIWSFQYFERIRQRFYISYHSPLYTFITYGFVHRTWDHLSESLIRIWDYGFNFLRIASPLEFVYLYLIGSIWSGFSTVYCSILRRSKGATKGASGGYHALLGYLSHYHDVVSTPLLFPQLFIPYSIRGVCRVIKNLHSIFIKKIHINDPVGHLGGFAFGFFYYWIGSYFWSNRCKYLEFIYYPVSEDVLFLQHH